MKNARAFSLFVALVFLLTLLCGCQKPNTQPAQETLNPPDAESDLAGTSTPVYPIDLRFTDYAVLDFSAPTEEIDPAEQEIIPPTGTVVTKPDAADIGDESTRATDPELPSSIAQTEPDNTKDGSTPATNPKAPSDTPQTEPGTGEGENTQTPDSEVPPEDPKSPPSESQQEPNNQQDVPSDEATGAASEENTPELMSSGSDGIVDGIISGVALDNTPPTTAFRYLEKTDSKSGLDVYRIQVQQEIKGTVTIFTGTMSGSEVQWDRTDVPIDAVLTDALVKHTQWLPCSQNSTYAINQDLVKCTVLGLTVIYSNSNNTLFQSQQYSETGALLYVAELSKDSKVFLAGNSKTEIDWSENLYPQLSLDTNTHTDYPSLLKKLFTVTVILAVVTVLFLAFNLTCLARSHRKRSRKAARKKRDVSPEYIPGSVTAVKSVGIVHNIGSRSGQQDSFDVVNCPVGTLAVVADGMGGLSDGDKVSQKIVATMRADSARIHPGQTDTVLCQMVSHANQEVNRMLGVARQYKCGSTLLAVLIEKYAMRWITVGDSRIYLYRGGSLIQINREHIYRTALLERAINGKLSFSEALHDPQADRLSSFVGMGELKHVDFCQNSLQLCPGDRVLLMSDGVFNALSNTEISRVISSTSDATNAAAQLEQWVLQKGAPNQDNFTCVILEV